MISPPFLQKGDTIAIAASARKISPGELQPAIDLFTSWGLFVELPENIYSRYNQFSGTDEERAADLQMLLDNPSVKAIVFARGGYGTVRIVDMLDFTAFSKHPKWIIGYSDITVLHSHIHSNLGIETLHSSMPINYNADNNDSARSFEELRMLLFGEVTSYSLKSQTTFRSGEAKGVVTGGNLSVLYSLLASNSDVDTTGKILFIEDIDEYLYHIDRMMIAFKRAGKLENLAGLVVGGFTDMRDNDIPFGKTAQEIITEAVKEYKYPVVFGLPAGHQALNLPVIFGREALLSANEMPYLRFNEPVPSKGLMKLKAFVKPAAFIITGFVVLYLLYSIILGRI